MADRLQRALRELAAALDEAAEEDRWEVVRVLEEATPALREGKKRESETAVHGSPTRQQPVASGGAEASACSSGTSSSVCGSTVSYHEDWRHYMGVECPGVPSLLGYVAGPASSTWRRLEARLPGGKLSASRARLRRVCSREEAAKVWAEAHPDVVMPTVRL